MDALTYIDTHGVGKATLVAEKAGSNYKYFSQIAYGHASPGKPLAAKLVKASKDLTPRKSLDLLSLLYPPRRTFQDGRSRGRKNGAARATA